MRALVDDALYEAIVRCSSEYDGRIYIGIRTTKIVCFPSCRSRTPRRDNIEVFASVKEACREGYRPCKRCRPDDLVGLAPGTVLAEQAEQLLRQHFPEKLTMTEVAATLYVSPRHLSRTLAAVWGMTLSQRWRDLWVEQSVSLLRNTELTIADIGVKVGMQSPSYFSRAFARAVGQTPRGYRQSCQGRQP